MSTFEGMDNNENQSPTAAASASKSAHNQG